MHTTDWEIMQFVQALAAACVIFYNSTAVLFNSVNILFTSDWLKDSFGATLKSLP